MSLLHAHSDAALAALRQAGGVATSPELQTRLGLSQPTVSRALAPLVATGRVMKTGAARAQRYLLPRVVHGVTSEGLGAVRIVEIDAHGQAHPFGNLVPLAGGAFWMEEHHGHSAQHPSLPWFLHDMRPQGFLGRGFALAHPELGLPPNVTHWNDDHVLKALASAGDDLPGNLVVGEQAFARYHTRAERTVTVEHAEADYPRLARQALQSVLPGSSAGGEQPKFCAMRNGHPVLVKFSPGGDSPADQRWRDLLVCECLALHTLTQGGIPAAHTELVLAEQRVFLESRRFDRTPQGGRVGMVSLEVYDAHYIGLGSDWVATAQRVDMAGNDRLTPADVRTLCLLDAYGALIANTDRHHGNISLLLVDGSWQLAPAYDMLPMLYAPVGTELVERPFAQRALHPSVHTLGVWPQALALARRFWQAAAEDPRISPAFRATAQANLRTVLAL